MGTITEEVMSKFYYEGSCGCGVLQFSQWKDDGVVFISYNIPAYNALQNTLGEEFKKRVKLMYNILLGREYRFYEIVIDNNVSLRKFKDFVADMGEIEDGYDY